MHHFILTSRWRLHASADRVWAVLTDVEAWLRWWRYVRAAHVESRGAADHVGDVAGIDWGSALAHGLWLLESAADGAVDVTYCWGAVQHRPWMRRLAPLLRPLFERNHFALMRGGARGMARQLGCRLSGLREWSGAQR